MFFPNSVLISRTPGIATIWLMATLGAKQNSRKVNKQAVLQIDIPESCQAVQHPDVPMALRLQSNLLYGISRVYSQQCLFVLAEAEMAQTALKNLFKHVRASELDPQAGKIRPELLVVPDDPAFSSGFDFPIIDFDSSATFDSSGASFMIDSDASGLSLVSSHSGQSLHEFMIPQLEIPSSGSIFGEPVLPLGPRGSLPDHQMSTEIADPDLLYDADFEFDTAGNIIEHDTSETASPRIRQLDIFKIPAQDTTSGQVQGAMPEANTEEATTALPFDDVQFLQDDDLQEAFLDSEADLLHASVEHEGQEQHIHSSESSEYIEAPQMRRRRKQIRELPRDTTIEIPHNELTDWEQNYVANMGNARKAKEPRKHARCARANAAFVLFSFGQSASQMIRERTADPLHDFTIDLVEQLTGRTADGLPARKNNKRRLDSADAMSSDPETRRARLRIHGPEGALHEAAIEAEGNRIGTVDNLDPSIELAREAMTMMEDQSTQLALPWSGSRAGSVHSGRLSRQGSILSTHAAGHTSIGRASSLHSLGRRASRLRSGSPLYGQAGAQNTPVGLASSFQLGSQGDQFYFDVGSGPGTSPQQPMSDSHGTALPGTMAGSSMHSLIVTQESTDFLTWIQDSLNAKMQQIGTGAEPCTKIAFDELLPTKDHTRAVAAQGFLHLLTLASRSAIEVSQPTKDNEGDDLRWGPIDISMARNS